MSDDNVRSLILVHNDRCCGSLVSEGESLAVLCLFVVIPNCLDRWSVPTTSDDGDDGGETRWTQSEDSMGAVTVVETVLHLTGVGLWLIVAVLPLLTTCQPLV